MFIWFRPQTPLEFYCHINFYYLSPSTQPTAVDQLSISDCDYEIIIILKKIFNLQRNYLNFIFFFRLKFNTEIIHCPDFLIRMAGCFHTREICFHLCKLWNNNWIFFCFYPLHLLFFAFMLWRNSLWLRWKKKKMLLTKIFRILLRVEGCWVCACVCLHKNHIKLQQQCDRSIVWGE